MAGELLRPDADYAYLRFSFVTYGPAGTIALNIYLYIRVPRDSSRSRTPGE